MKKIQNRASFDLQTFLTGFLIISGILVTLGSLAVSMANDYSEVTTININSSFVNTYNKLDTITSETESLQGKLEQSDVGEEDANTQFFGGALSAVKIAIPALGVFQAMIQDGATLLHVPTIWIVIASLSLIIMFFTMLIFMVFKYR